MKTRKQYMDKECTFREYYGQFVTDEVRRLVLQRIGKGKLLASTDPHLNDIPLRRWDVLPALSSMAEGLKSAGDYLTLAGKVCIYKEAAHQIIDEAESEVLTGLMEPQP